MLHPILFVKILFSYKYVAHLGILSSVIKLTDVKQQVFLFIQKEMVEKSPPGTQSLKDNLDNFYA